MVQLVALDPLEQTQHECHLHPLAAEDARYQTIR
jgi:hypothetical protein